MGVVEVVVVIVLLAPMVGAAASGWCSPDNENGSRVGATRAAITSSRDEAEHQESTEK